MNTLKTILIFLPLILLKNDSAKSYYFQLSDFTESKVYKYECISDSSKTEYWKLTSVLNDNTLITEAYSSDFRKYEFFKEEFTKDGSKVLEFVSYPLNKSGKTEIINKTLKELDVFKWEKEKNYKYSSEYNDRIYGKISFEKIRTFIGKEKISILGRVYKVLKFKGIYKTEIPLAKYKYEYQQFSYYAKGIGLVKMEKKYTDGTAMVLELTEIISSDDWQNRQ